MMWRYHVALILLAGTSSMLARKIRLGFEMMDRPIAHETCASLLPPLRVSAIGNWQPSVGSRHREISRQ
jgi:hypothetical protein